MELVILSFQMSLSPSHFHLVFSSSMGETLEKDQRMKEFHSLNHPRDIYHMEGSGRIYFLLLMSSSNTYMNTSNERQCNNVYNLIFASRIYVAQIASQGKLLMWGAKINSLIDKGQIWRLMTSSLLHANIGHLMVNCYSLNSIGPTVENLTGPRRFLAVYVTSAIASCMTSYRLCKAPAVGASGAIFGLVGSAAVFVMRHRGMIRGGKEDLQYIAQVIFLNMVIGILSKGIDNWGHVGGLLGGIATSWLLGPSWKYESLSDNRTRIFIDRAPIKYLTNRKRISDNRN